MPPSVPALRTLVLRTDSGDTVVRLSGELDIATGPLVAEQLADLLDGLPTRPVPRLVLDLSELVFTDVVGLGVLLRIQQRVAAHGGTVVLRRPPQLVRRVVALLGLESRLPTE